MPRLPLRHGPETRDAWSVRRGQSTGETRAGNGLGRGELAVFRNCYDCGDERAAGADVLIAGEWRPMWLCAGCVEHRSRRVKVKVRAPWIEDAVTGWEPVNKVEGED